MKKYYTSDFIKLYESDINTLISIIQDAIEKYGEDNVRFEMQYPDYEDYERPFLICRRECTPEEIKTLKAKEKQEKEYRDRFLRAQYEALKKQFEVK